MKSIDSLNDVIGRFKENSNGFLSHYAYWLAVVAASVLFDMVSTIHFMLRDGTSTELHPAIKIVSMILGPVLGPVVGKLIQFGAIVAIAIYLRRFAVYIFIITTFLYTWAAWYNVWGCEIYCPRISILFEWMG